jgi:predicted CXXCH cytochrome family protein
MFALGVAQEPEHPVTLPADTDSAKCAECHTDKKEGKHVHTAVSTIGCMACHQVQTEKDTTRIKLLSPVAELCTTCHAPGDDPDVHPPYARKDCLLCHDPHTTDFDKQTRAPLNGLCLACHGERAVKGTEVKLFGTRSLPADQFAQIPKIVLDRSQRLGHPFLEHPVTGGPDPLREGQAFSCLSCHLPHEAPQPKLLGAAWKKAEVCDECHSAAAAIKAAKREESPKPPSAGKPEKPERLEKP